MQLNGYEEIQKSLSGDDDLFLQLVKRKTNWKIQYAVEKASIVPSYQTISLMDFFKQKKRHLSAGKYYAFKTQLSYLFYHLVNLSLFVIFVYSIFEIRLLFPASILFAAKLLIDWLLLKYTGNKFDVKFKFLVFIIWEIFFLIYHFLMAPASWFGKIKWKL